LIGQEDESISSCLHCNHCNDSTKIVILLKDISNNKDIVVICDDVICTMSLGYLKYKAKDIFEPTNCIPNSKYSSIERLEFGTTNKVIGLS
jgi:hypothetical protein